MIGDRLYVKKDSLCYTLVNCTVAPFWYWYVNEMSNHFAYEFIQAKSFRHVIVADGIAPTPLSVPVQHRHLFPEPIYLW